MNTKHRRAVAALIGAGLLWGTSVPLSKLALEWLPPGWLTVSRFGLAALVLLLAAPRANVRAACRPLVLLSGAFGYGGSVAVQNAGITRTSVTDAALLVGAVPVLIAVIAALWQHSVARPVAWLGFAVSLAGVGLITGGRGGSASLTGDGLVLASLLLSATFTVGQARLLRGRDPIAVTAVQFLGAALAVMPFAAAEGTPASPHAGALLATLVLAAGGTLLPFTLFAYGQSRVRPEIAGAFVNLEPLVGAVAGVAFFGDPVGPVQAAGGAAILLGIVLSSFPLLVGRHHVAKAHPAEAAPGLLPGGYGSRLRPRPLGYCRPGAGSDVERELGQAAAAEAAAVARSAAAGRGLPAGDQACRRRVHRATRTRVGGPRLRGSRARRAAVERGGHPVPGGAGRRGRRHPRRAGLPPSRGSCRVRDLRWYPGALACTCRTGGSPTRSTTATSWPGWRPAGGGRRRARRPCWSAGT